MVPLNVHDRGGETLARVLPRHEQSRTPSIILEAVQIPYMVYHIIFILGNLVAVCYELVGHFDVVQEGSVAQLKDSTGAKMQI